MTSAFWRTIERVPGHATDTLDWKVDLIDCWTQVERYLPETSKYAERIDCPWPGGEHCPRHVVRHAGGLVRAVCSDPGRLCETLDINPDDIRIRELDRRRLFADIATALGLVAPTAPSRGAVFLHIGDHAIAAGRSFPVFAALTSPRAPLSRADVLDIDRRNLPFVLLVTSLGAIDPDVSAFLAARQGRVLTWAECLHFALAPRKGFVAAMPLVDLFAPEIAALANAGDVAQRPVMTLPANARWSDLRFAFREEAVLNVSYLGQAPARLEPDQIGMRDERNGKPNRQWRLLLVCAALGGALPRSFPISTIKGRRPASDIVRILGQFQRGYEKQRQLLAAALRERFGIDEDPFSGADDCYEARFLVDASSLKQGRSDQRDRNFADDD
ncbi:MAG: hypothetical protein ACOYJQ_12810 [Pseudochelatococcus sp.]|jgi:hypothetical protein|uniref:hypothetical protein n=1 Tax=Pseudochelatococcus sp. TaxID=2020869 RepID=UPI003D8BD75B